MEYTVKKATPGVSFGRRGPTVTSRASNRDGASTHSCNRLGCSTRYNSDKGAEISNIEKLKSSSGRSLNSRSKATTSSSSRSASSSISVKKTKEQKTQISRPRQVASEECNGCLELIDDRSRYEVIRNPLSIPTATGDTTVAMDLDGPESDSHVGSSQEGSDTSTSSTVGNHQNLRKHLKKRPVSGSQDASFGSSVRRTAAGDMQTIKPPQRRYSNITHRYGLRNLSCSSISDVLPSGSPASNSLNSMTRSFTRSYPDPGSSSSRGKSRKGSNGEQLTIPPTAATPAVTGPSLSRPSLRTCNRPATSTTAAVAARSGRTCGEGRVRTVTHEDDMFSLPQPFVVEQSPPTQSSSVETEAARPSRGHAVIAESTQRRQGRSGTAQSSRSAHVRPSSQLSDRSRRVPVGRLADRNGYQHFNMAGVAEVLLALEQIEQDADLSYEQLLLLETNLLLGGLGIHDQHREMRLDIDNMSYEELLALGDEIGTVTTALSEEELSKCLRRSIYKTGSMTPDASGDCDDDVKCCVCQEEYRSGDEVGKLAICGHLYHAACIQQWFLLKNWCPICKSSASSS